jgi:6-pyruvoyltetrahydropterin/6-carboxytetrahydropterin synthase
VELKRIVHAVLDRMDHQWLNEFPPFDVLNPSAENMAKYIYDEISAGIRTREGVQLASVRLWETDTASATYRP